MIATAPCLRRDAPAADWWVKIKKNFLAPLCLKRCPEAGVHRRENQFSWFEWEYMDSCLCLQNHFMVCFSISGFDRLWHKNQIRGFSGLAIPEHQFSLSLDQSLITAMEDEARWMIKNYLTTEKKVPDFLNYIYADGLKAVKPEAVNIIRWG